VQQIFRVNKISASASRKNARRCRRTTQKARAGVRRMAVNPLNFQWFLDLFTFYAACEKPCCSGKSPSRKAFCKIDAVLDARVRSDPLSGSTVLHINKG
jgi:hypothetical protein